MSNNIKSNNNNNNNNNKDYLSQQNLDENELYITIPNPDNRKRFTIIYEKNENEIERCVLMIPKTLSYAGLLGLIISKFKLDPSNRSQLRVKTLEGNRIKTLNKTYNNQILNVTISTIIDEDPEDEISNRALTKSQEYALEIKEKQDILKREQFKYLPLYNENGTTGENNNNLFYNQIIDKLLLLSSVSTCKFKLIIGESYPYRCKVLISDPIKESKIWLYFIEKLQETSTTTKLNYEFKLILEQQSNNNNNKNQIDTNKIIQMVNKQIEIDNQDVEKIIKMVQEFYQDNFKFEGKESNVGMYDQSLLLFQGYVQPKTVSQNHLLNDIYSKIKTVSKYYDIPTSLARKLLFQNQWDTKKVIGNEKEKNDNILNIKSFSFPHKTKDIKLFKFKTQQSLTEEEECSICYCEYTPNEMIQLICGHKFCVNCLNMYFKSSIIDANGGSNPINCPSNGCLNKCIDEVTIETLLFEQQQQSNRSATRHTMVEKALQIFINDILYTRPNSHLCPEDDCGRLLLDCNSIHKKVPYVNCNGDHLFCLLCKGKHLHWPSPCNKQLLSDSDLFSFKWIIQNTTICGQCKFPVEKNQGCNHMTCSRCRYQFCYLCGAPWLSHIECDKSDRNKVNQFLNVFANKGAIDSSFLEDFILIGTFRGNDPISMHIYQSFLSILTNSYTKNKKQIQFIQKLLGNLLLLSNSKIGTDEYESSLFSCRTHLKRLLSSDDRWISTGVYNRNSNSGLSSTLSLSVSICLNGSKKSLAKLFVNRQFHEFKEEIAAQLNKLIPKDQVEYDAKKIRIYNLYGGQIKSSLEILNNEPIFIAASIYEPWIEPQLPTLTKEEIEIANQQLEKERESIIQLNSNEILTPISPKKEKRKNDIIKLKQDIENNLKMKEYLKSNYVLPTKVDDSQKEVNTPSIEMTEYEIRSQYYYFTNLLVGINDTDSDSNSGDDFGFDSADSDSNSGDDLAHNDSGCENINDVIPDDYEERIENERKVEEYLETLRVINDLLDEDDRFHEDENPHDLDDEQMEYSEDTECELTFQMWRDHKSKFHVKPKW